MSEQKKTPSACGAQLYEGGALLPATLPLACFQAGLFPRPYTDDELLDDIVRSVSADATNVPAVLPACVALTGHSGRIRRLNDPKRCSCGVRCPLAWRTRLQRLEGRQLTLREVM